MRWGFLSLFLLASLDFRVSFLLAQEVEKQDEQPNPTPPSQQQNVSQMKPITVTATRMETPMQETAASVTVVGEDEIRQQQATTIAEALRNVPGLEIAQNSYTRNNHRRLYARSGNLPKPSCCLMASRSIVSRSAPQI